MRVFWSAIAVTFTLALASCGVSVGMDQEGAQANWDDGDKVTICHIPPGNPANAHTIVVGAPAVGAHLAHGDYLGPCDGNGGGDDDCPGDGGTCSSAGSACTDTVACCSGLTCLGGTCQVAPTCGGSGASCSAHSDCCDGYACAQESGEPCPVGGYCACRVIIN